MNKYIYRIFLLIFLMVDPSFFTTSSTVTSNVLTEKEYIEIMKNIKIKDLKNKIKKEFDLFYLNLDSMNTPKHTKKFIEDLTCNALEAKSLPSISIAQAAIETGYGKHLKLKYNIFGIKGKGIRSKTKEFINGKYVVINSEFQHFNNMKLAFDRHFEIIDKYGVKGDNYLDWIKIIVSHGYATDPRYDKKLKYIIKKFQIYRLDKIQKLTNELNKIENDKI